MKTTPHTDYMRRALALAARAKGKTAPNPMVGCLVVKNGRILSEGYHPKAGEAHAEVIALRKLKKEEMKGATLYVTMEPCSIQGKTPPCVPRVIQSGIDHVAIGTQDPNPRVNGNGIRQLREAGLQVTEGVLAKECADLNKPYAKWIRTGIPYVTLKVALSLDGKIATAAGESKWISNEASRKEVHRLRSEVDAILVGGGTVRKDDPLLNVRFSEETKNPTVVVFDPTLNITTSQKLFSIPERELIFATTSKAPPEKVALFEKKGAEVWTLDSDTQGKIDLQDLMKSLGERQKINLLLEGGGGLYSSLIKGKWVDRVVAFITPKILGGKAHDWLPGLSTHNMEEALSLTNVVFETFGSDIKITGDMT